MAGGKGGGDMKAHGKPSADEREIVRLRNRCDALLLEAQVHAQEARTANATIAEIYQVVSGGRGECGNWHGAEPVQKEIVRLTAELAQAQARTERFQRLGEEGYASLALQSRDAILHEFCQLQIKYGEQKHEIRRLQAREARVRVALEGLVGCPDLPAILDTAEQAGKRSVTLRMSIAGLRQGLQALTETQAAK